jgi:hypothetical protein
VTTEDKLTTDHRRRAGHREILGETYAKFEFFEKGWNPYSRFLDVDKVDLILRRVDSGRKIYREVQVKYMKLWEIKTGWLSKHFDRESWRFFQEDEFSPRVSDSEFFVACVLAADVGYQGDIFIFPIRDFVDLIKRAVGANGAKKKMYLSRLRDDNRRWVMRRNHRSFAELNDESCVDVSKYRRNFPALDAAL